MKNKIICLAVAAALFASLFAFAGCGSEKKTRNTYDISASYADGTLAASMEFTYVNQTGEALSFLEFNLFGNAYREDSAYAPVSAAFEKSAYYAGESYGGMEISSVSPCASWSVCGADENILRVELENGLAAGERVTLQIGWALSLAEVSHRTGIAPRSVNLGNFYPVVCVFEEGSFYECEYYSDGDPFYSECADYTVTFRADKKYTVASSGKILSAREDGQDKVYEMSLENARDFAIVLGEEYSLAQGEACGAQIMYYYYDDAAPEEKLALIEKSISFFSEKFGDYAYPTYSVVQTGFSIGGMEYPALTMIGDHLAGADYRYTIVHETAHQWWYAAVGSNQLENAWMDEGLTEYSAALFYRENPDPELPYESIVDAAYGAYKALYTVYSQIFGEADTTMNRKLGEYLSEYQYVCIAYDKGLILFDTLQKETGEKKFFAALKGYYADRAGKIARPEHLKTAFKKAGANVAGIIDSFVDGKAVI